MKAKEITWVEGRHGFFAGGIDGVHLFTYGWDTIAPKGEKKPPYKLTPTLPGVHVFNCSTPAHCRVVAARELSKFLSRLAEDTQVEYNQHEGQEHGIGELAEKQPKLDRKTRGQVTRVTNKLLTVEQRDFPSSSNPNTKYHTVVYQTGKVLCNCLGWTMKKGANPRQCRHTAELIGDRATKTDGEFIYIESLAIASGALRFSEEGAC